MEGNEYQKAALRTATGESFDLTNAALGLNGEAGEFADVVKKYKFHHHDFNREHMLSELGDALWYIAVGAAVLGVDLESVMRQNIAKLWARYPDGFDSKKSKHREPDDV